jgi:arylsulfatase A-like enzyme
VRGLARWIGYAVLVLLAIALGGAVLAAWRLWAYEQREAPEALARKESQLERMEALARAPAKPPNVVVILFDDLGRADVGAFGSRALSTPRLDALAAEGVALDHYYAPAPVCSPSRAGLLTGRWPIRTGLTQVLFPTGSSLDRVLRLQGRPVRLPADEITLAEALRAGGYATAFVGKWHLGDHAPSLPHDLGFDQWYGVLHSNDMSPLPLWRDGEIEEPHPIDQAALTPKYTREAVAFIEAHRDGPFLLYLAHTFPHIPLHATPEQRGRSDAGLYGDVVADLDRSTGAVLDALERLGLAEQTLVVVTSDNGPWFEGSPGALRGRKGETFEGGMRVPFLARWPGRIPAGVRSDAVAAGVDLFPTALALAGVPLPDDRVIDGVDLTPLLTRGRALPERPILFHVDRTLEAIRVGRFKWQARRGVAYPGIRIGVFVPVFPKGPWLFDLARDPDESYDVHEKQPDAFARLSAMAERYRAGLDENPRGWRTD